MARENWRDWIALVTEDQNLTDSLGSCSGVGGRSLGEMVRGVRSIMGIRVSCEYEC